MFKRTLSLLSLASLVTLFILPAAYAETAAPILKAGKWETSFTVDIPGLPIKMKPIKSTTCLSEEDVADPDKSLPSAQNDPKCKVIDRKIEGSKVTWAVKCSGDSDVSSRGEMTVAEDGYEGVITAITDGQEMATKIQGKRVGDCTKKK